MIDFGKVFIVSHFGEIIDLVIDIDFLIFTLISFLSLWYHCTLKLEEILLSH